MRRSKQPTSSSSRSGGSPVPTGPDCRIGRTSANAERCCYVLSRGFRRCWQTSDGPLGEGELLLGRAVSGREGWVGGRRIVRRTTGVGVGQLLGQAANQNVFRCVAVVGRSRARRSVSGRA
jgi:hypothetical protein